MDGRILVSVLAAVISTACTVQNPAVNPLQNIENDSVEEIDKIPFFRNLPEEPEPYYNRRMYSPPSYGYGNMMMHPPRRPYHHPYGPGYARPMYMDLPPEIPHKWGPRYPVPDPPTIAYWLSKFNMNKPNEQPDINKTQNATNATTTTTTITTTTITPTTETITETTTQILVVETTETPKQQAEELGEEPKQRQLPTKKTGKDCGPDEETVEASTTVANEQQPPITTTMTTTTSTSTAAAAAEPVSTSQETPGNVPAASVAPLIKAAPSEEEVVPLATLRRNSFPILPEMGLPPMYPGKSLYGAAYPPMPYLPEMPLDPYAEYRRMDHHPMYPRIPQRYYGF